MKTILIAEDDVVFRQVLAEFLSAFDFEIALAGDAFQASSMIMRPPHPDLVILDIRMPAGTGMAVLQRIRNNIKTSRIPVIAISSDNLPSTHAEAKRLGAREFMAKPVDLNTMLMTVRRLLRVGAVELEPPSARSASG